MWESHRRAKTQKNSSEIHTYPNNYKVTEHIQQFIVDIVMIVDQWLSEYVLAYGMMAHMAFIVHW